MLVFVELFSSTGQILLRVVVRRGVLAEEVYYAGEHRDNKHPIARL
jgi:hypothetical protein